jgi:glycine/D-amino acid oxidase-like deaminating enzyme
VSKSPFDPEAASEIRDLRTGTSLWASSAPRLLRNHLRQSAKADVVIVGAGITGALLAHTLAQRGLSVLMLDRRAPAHGSTMASTALLQWEIDTPLVKLADRIGFERASRAWRRCFSAVGALGRLVRDHRIRCALTPRRSLYLTGDVMDGPELSNEARARQSIGLPSTLLGVKELRDAFGICRPAALISDGVADIDPVRLTLGLLRRAQSMDTKIFYPEELAQIYPAAKSVGMATTSGKELESRALVFATGYELADGVPPKGHRRTSTWAFATPQQRQSIWRDGLLIWEASTPYLYMRTTWDGRVLVGGEDEPFSDEQKRDALLAQKVRSLQRKTKELLPALGITAEYAWAGTFGESETGLPSFGAVPGMPNCYAVLGYGGNGFTFGAIAAQVIAGELTGSCDSDAELFAFRP